jgi:pimeloyl-ACP methyl ester carboxylesterase
MLERMREKPIEQRVRGWITERREMAGLSPRKYATLDDAVARMMEENKRLSAEQARHLTTHGALQNEDGTWSWKFDNFVRMGGGPGGLSVEDQRHIWGNITCSVLLVRGTESWASDPVADGRIKHFRNAQLANVEGAGHWVHHDRLDVFMNHVDTFLAE